MKTKTEILVDESENDLIECSHCSEKFERDSMTSLNNGDLVCETCLNENYSICEDSDEYFPNDEIFQAYKHNSRGDKIEVYVHENASNYEATISGEIWHSDFTYSAHDSRGRDCTISIEDLNDGDFFTCEDCNEIFHNDTSSYINNHGSVCESCYSDSYHYCESCDESVSNNDSCDCSDESCDGIYNHDYKPKAVFRGKNSLVKPFMGFEVEVKISAINSGVNIVKNLFDENFIYLKEDSSIGGGFEIVSHPMTLEAHKENKYKEMFEGLSSVGGKSHDTSTCGLHVHLDKRDMGDNHKVRFGAFFALNKDKMELLARRSSEQWAKFKPIDSEMDEFRKSESRYEAVNWENSHTVEVRIFRGTLKYETFMASLELCQAVFAFTHKPRGFVEFTGKAVWAKFEKFLSNKKSKIEYPFLLKYLEDKKAAGPKIKWSEVSDELNHTIDSNDSENISA